VKSKIKQKINERGLFEKIGHTVSKYGDILTGGSVRGLIGGLLPRGAGYKVMNALDIEEVLQRNLKVINEAIKSGSDSKIVDILKGLGKPSPKAKGEILKFTDPKNFKTAEEYVKAQTSNNSLKVLLCNGAPKSKQSFNYNMESFIIDLAKTYNDVHFICTEKFNTVQKNILFKA
jgi:hypothetical protein